MTAILTGRDTTTVGDKTFVFTQAVAASTWVVAHPLGKRPSVTTTSLADKIVEGAVTYLSDDALQIDFSMPFSGRAYLN